MKPQNYSVKFQNSLADCRIIPGSQHLLQRSNALIPNGQRALRKPTKAELKRAKKAKPKDRSKQLLSKNSCIQKEEHAWTLATEKGKKAEIAAPLKGLFINSIDMCKGE